MIQLDVLSAARCAAQMLPMILPSSFWQLELMQSLTNGRKVVMAVKVLVTVLIIQPLWAQNCLLVHIATTCNYHMV